MNTKQNNSFLNINNQSSLMYDHCSTDYYNKMNESYFNRQFDPTIDPSRPNGTRDQYINNTQVKGTMESLNYDTKGELINTNTSLRNGIMTHDGHRQGLDTRIFIGSPYLAAGQSELKNTDLSSRLRYSETTRSFRSTGSNETSINNFIPLIPCIANNVQDPKHIIPEYWVRGGMSSRSIIRNIDYLKSCGKTKN